MSLVSYGYDASDDSETSDVEDQDAPVTVPLSVSTNSNETADPHPSNARADVDDQISDEEEYETVGHSSQLFSKENLTIGIDLPAPQKREKELTVEETELEDEVRQKPAELAEAPKPPPSRAKKPVRITIPSLNQIEDDDEEEVGTSRIAPSKVKSGLFSLLPPPIHSSKKEINRPLVPHSLGKKPIPPKPKPSPKTTLSSSSADSPSTTTTSTTPAAKVVSDAHSVNASAFKGLAGYDDSDDGEEEEGSISFFSLDSSSKVKETNSISSHTTTTNLSDNTQKASSSTNVIASKQGSSSSSNNNSSSSVTNSKSKQGKTQSVVKVKEDGDNNASMEIEPSDVPLPPSPPAKPEPGLVNDSPLDFGHALRFSSWSSASHNQSQLDGLRPSYQQLPSSSSVDTPASSSQYNMAHLQSSSSYTSGDVGNGDELQQLMNDKEFQKFKGKRKRGMEEEISFVDANVDDYVDPSELAKHITEESEYSSVKSQGDMPTSQQRRKKQITYLAFQAKEKEMELKNTWSQNKMTRKQTQAKYGF